MADDLEEGVEEAPVEVPVEASVEVPEAPDEAPEDDECIDCDGAAEAGAPCTDCGGDGEADEFVEYTEDQFVERIAASLNISAIVERLEDLALKVASIVVSEDVVEEPVVAAPEAALEAPVNVPSVPVASRADLENLQHEVARLAEVVNELWAEIRSSDYATTVGPVAI